jgi:Mlc titration factor MtfA (ptsG expression regulator)
MLFQSKPARRQKLLAEPFPDEWLAILRENVFLYRLLSEAEQAKLRDALRIFIAEKYWEGCRGQEITDEVKVTIAGQACLLLLGFEDYYFDNLQTVLVYPNPFLREDPYEEDVEEELSGQAAARGPVICSWRDARRDGRRLRKQNLVLHEFAHVLGQYFDPHQSVPMPDDPAQRRAWRSVLLTEYRRLCEAADRRQPTLLDPYGTSNLAEFFAVSTECFFLRPVELKQTHHELYAALANFYNQDPASRQVWSGA